MTDHQPPPAVEAIGRLEELANQFARRAEFHARFADGLPADDGYRPMADGDADEAHQYAADLRAVIAEARRSVELAGALEPFAEAARNMDGDEPDGLTIWESPKAMMLVFGNLRKARAALDRRAGT